MQGEVVALSDEDYARQLEDLEPVRVAAAAVGNPAVVEHESPATLLSLAAVGQRVSATSGCLRCHTVDGTPHIGPTWAGLYQATIRLEGGGTVIADEAYLTKSMMDPAADIHLGFKPVMPSYQGLLTAPQVGAIVEYIRSLRDAPRHTGSEPLPTQTGDVPIVTPLPGDKPSAPAADDLKRDEPGDLYAPPGGPR
jgi:cytochrome c oxidase subunit 2